jgi:hypothetical protein
MTVAVADLAEWLGRFAGGWDDDDIDSVLPQISEQLGLEIVCIWDYSDASGPGGHSNLIAVVNGEARTIPDDLWNLLLWPESDLPDSCMIDPTTVGKVPDPDYAPDVLSAATLVGTCNYCIEDRCKAEGIDATA